MKSNASLLLIALALCIVSCKNNSSDKKFDKIQKMNWLIGSWENKMPDGTLTETWTKTNDSIFEGKSLFVKEKDTIHFETIQLRQKGDDLIYSATVIGQNNDDAVDFKFTSETGNGFTFENPAHDYPQKITYKKINDAHLIATISGKQQGKLSSESYPMTKSK